MTVHLVDFPSGGRGRYGLAGDTGAGFISWAYSVGMYLYEDPRPGADGQGVVWGTGQGTNTYMLVNLPDVLNRFVYSFRIFMYSLPGSTGDAPRFRLFEATDGISQDISIRPDGGIGGDGYIVAGAWQLVEVMFGAGPGATPTGIEIRIDGETVFTAPNGGAPHRPNVGMPIYSFQILSSGAPNFCAIKDFVLQYTTAADFIGPCNVRELVPQADVSSGWTRAGAASDYAVLDNAPPVDAQYIAAPDPIPAPSITALAGLRPNTKAIHGLFPALRLSSASGGSVQASLVAGGTPRAGAVVNPGVTAAYYQDAFLLDPATGLPWDPATVGALNLSINRTV